MLGYRCMGMFSAMREEYSVHVDVILASDSSSVERRSACWDELDDRVEWSCCEPQRVSSGLISAGPQRSGLSCVPGAGLSTYRTSTYSSDYLLSTVQHPVSTVHCVSLLVIGMLHCRECNHNCSYGVVVVRTNWTTSRPAPACRQAVCDDDSIVVQTPSTRLSPPYLLAARSGHVAQRRDRRAAPAQIDHSIAQTTRTQPRAAAHQRHSDLPARLTAPLPPLLTLRRDTTPTRRHHLSARLHPSSSEPSRRWWHHSPLPARHHPALACPAAVSTCTGGPACTAGWSHTGARLRGMYHYTADDGAGG